MSIRLVIVDKQPLVHLGFKALLSNLTKYDIVESCFDANSVFPVLVKEKPDLLIIDADLPWESGLMILETLVTHDQSIKVVVFSKEISADNYLKLMQFGVNGVLLKDMPLNLITECLNHVSGGGDWLEKNTIRQALKLLMDQSAQKSDCQSKLLTNRELEVARLIRAGLSNQEIAKQLYVSEGTIKLHLNKIYYKLKIKGRLQLALQAETWTLI